MRLTEVVRNELEKATDRFMDSSKAETTGIRAHQTIELHPSKWNNIKIPTQRIHIYIASVYMCVCVCD